MRDFVETFLFLAIGCLGLATLFAAAAGVAGLFGGRIERCPDCHRYSLTVDGRVHAEGCPVTSHRRDRYRGDASGIVIGSTRRGTLRHAFHH
jgi:hypothetical protein